MAGPLLPPPSRCWKDPLRGADIVGRALGDWHASGGLFFPKFRGISNNIMLRARPAFRKIRDVELSLDDRFKVDEPVVIFNLSSSDLCLVSFLGIQSPSISFTAVWRCLQVPLTAPEMAFLLGMGLPSLLCFVLPHGSCSAVVSI